MRDPELPSAAFDEIALQRARAIAARRGGVEAHRAEPRGLLAVSTFGAIGLVTALVLAAGALM